MNCKEMANKACDKVRDGELKIIPNTFEKTWYQWLDDCRYYLKSIIIVTLTVTRLTWRGLGSSPSREAAKTYYKVL